MKYKIFDVVKLKNQNNATILNIENNKYKVEIVDKNGVRQSVTEIYETDIDKPIVRK